jgi:hypothetical protein
LNSVLKTLNSQQHGKGLLSHQGGIVETQERIEDDSMAKKMGDGKDELNLAE